MHPAAPWPDVAAGQSGHMAMNHAAHAFNESRTHMMDCSILRAHISQYLAGTLHPDQLVALGHHWLKCDACRQYLLSRDQQPLSPIPQIADPAPSWARPRPTHV